MIRCNVYTDYGARCVYIAGHRGTHLGPTKDFLEICPQLSGPIQKSESAWLGHFGSCFWTFKKNGDFTEFIQQKR
jgi:hypothetical protein